jgi:exopolysaccharide production protein ExoZ
MVDTIVPAQGVQSPRPVRPRLLGLEAGRFVAALLVACFHFSLAFKDMRNVYIFDMMFRPGHAGVEYFFVLSGFIIYHIHKGDIGRPERARDFAIKRFLRLYPAFWMVSITMLAAMMVMPSLEGKRDLGLTHLGLDFLLLPLNGDALLLQSWSLRHEIVFYALFAIAILRARVGIPILIGWQVASWTIGAMYPMTMPDALRPFLFIFNVGFGFGIGAAWLCERWQPARPGWIALLGLTAFVGCMAWEWQIGRYWPVATRPLGPVASPLLYISSATILIFGVTQYERMRPLPLAGLLRILGGCSYLLYLIHAPMGSFVIRIFNMGALKTVPNWAVFVAMIAASIAASILAHLLFEKPFLLWARSKLLKPRAATPPQFATAR